METTDESETESHDRTRGKRRVPLSVLVVCVVAVGLLAPAVANAGLIGPSFSDVPESHPFYDEIQWMALSGVSEGYPDGTYRPTGNVSRQEMAAFMQRLYDFQEDLSWDVRSNSSSTNSTAFVDIPGALTQVTVPDGAWANLAARFTAESNVTGDPGMWGTVRLMVSKDGGSFNEMQPALGNNSAFDSVGVANDYWESHAIERFAEGSGGVYTIKAQYAVNLAGAAFAVDDLTIVAETDLQPTTWTPS
jgi:hypothetical protein